MQICDAIIVFASFAADLVFLGDAHIVLLYTAVFLRTAWFSSPLFQVHMTYPRGSLQTDSPETFVRSASWSSSEECQGTRDRKLPALSSCCCCGASLESSMVRHFIEPIVIVKFLCVYTCLSSVFLHRPRKYNREGHETLKLESRDWDETLMRRETVWRRPDRGHNPGK